MGTIFDKGISGDKCLILNPREALFYNFNFTSGWEEVRIGMLYSFTNSTGSNGEYGNETVTNSSFNGTNNIYFGITTSPDNLLPYPNTGVFIGMTSFTGANITLGNGTISNQSRYGVINGAVFTGSVLNYSTSYMAMPSQVNASGTGAYIGCYATKIRINPISKTFIVRSANTSSSNGNASTVFLRQQMNSFTNEIPNVDSTGYYTDNFASNGNLLQYPDKILIYFPFFNNRARIHNLAIEKYN